MASHNSNANANHNLSHIHTLSYSANQSHSPCCCCARPGCAFLRQNQLALEGLEKDLETAARLGQALLHRHESYIAQAEEDRCRSLASIEALERQRCQVQAENARIVQENRGLVEQLDALNNALADSDAQVNTLTAALENTEAELRTVGVSAARAEHLEAQLSQLESEQAKTQDSLQSKQEDEKSAVQRWKKAESTLRDLHEQVDRMEKEARDERDRHADLVQRMERRRTVERELDGAAGRLKGAAAAHELGRQPHGTNVVSRFVRDILQDNANLQIGVMELRDLLESSNQEVQGLRDQILSHQPLDAAAGEGEEEQERPESTQPAMRLSQELDSKDRVPPEYHIHHHYHPPTISNPKKEKPKLGRRLTKKRRSVGSPAMLHSAANSHLGRQPSTSSTSTILSQTSVSIPPSSSSATSHPWSTRTPAIESLASSPVSGYHRPASIFDRVERGFESSQPTSPESTAFSSPLFGARHKTLDPPFQDGLDRAIDDELISLEALNDRNSTVPAIPEEREDLLPAPYIQENGQRPRTPDVFTSPLRNRRRRPSHDSLFSVAGMDIHTPTRRHSRMHDLQGYPIRSRPRRNFSYGGEFYPTPPVISTSNVTADREAPSKTSQHSPRRLLASVCRSASHDVENAPDATPSRKPSLSRRVGGWVRGRWGTGAERSDQETQAQARPSSASSNTAPPPAPAAPTTAQPQSPTPERPSSASGIRNKMKADCVSALRFRHPGVNQKGPIMGFRPPPQAPTSVQPEGVDERLLRESLAE